MADTEDKDLLELKDLGFSLDKDWQITKWDLVICKVNNPQELRDWISQYKAHQEPSSGTFSKARDGLHQWPMLVYTPTPVPGQALSPFSGMMNWYMPEPILDRILKALEGA